MLTVIRVACHALAGLACALGAGLVCAQNYPAKPVRYIVPYGPGATLDIVARTMAPEMSRALGQPLIVENKPGADAIIGLEHVAKQSPADGYTVTIAAVAGLATLPLTVKELRFDPLKDLPPFSTMVAGRSYLGTPPNAPFDTALPIILQARVTTSINRRWSAETAPFSRCCSIRYCVSVTLRPGVRVIVCFSSLSNQRAEGAALDFLHCASAGDIAVFWRARIGGGGPTGVVIDQGPRLRMIDLEPFFYRFLTVIVALHEIIARHIVLAGHLGRVE